MPVAWEEFTEAELTDALAETRWQAEAMLTLAHDLEVKLPGTKAAFRTGTLRQSKVAIIATRSPPWTRPRPAPPRPSCWTGPGG
jgi:hypothetical protein